MFERLCGLDKFNFVIQYSNAWLLQQQLTICFNSWVRCSSINNVNAWQKRHLLKLLIFLLVLNIVEWIAHATWGRIWEIKDGCWLHIVFNFQGLCLRMGTHLFPFFVVAAFFVTRYMIATLLFRCQCPLDLEIEEMREVAWRKRTQSFVI